MDWSMCKPHAQYPLLRPELIFKSQIPVRFLPVLDPLLTHDASHVLVLLLCLGTIAILSRSLYIRTRALQISNLCLRFMWLTYVPVDGLNLTLRTFIAAMMEMLRRVQWNFCTPFFLLGSPVHDTADQTDSKTNISVIWISTASRARCRCRIALRCIRTRKKRKNMKRKSLSRRFRVQTRARGGGNE